MFTKSRTRIQQLTALSGAALVTAAVIAASTQAGVGGAEASVTAAQPVTSQYSLAHQHPYLHAGWPIIDTVTVTNPGPQSGYKGHPETLAIKAVSTFGLPLKFQATGLPGGLVISSSGVISGTPRYGADPPITSTVTVTATDTDGAHGSATFTWSIDWIQHCKPTTCT
jgi:hypothetical protein